MLRPDLIILELELPDIDGLHVIAQLREWASTPIIVLSARCQESTKVAALDGGADDYLTKLCSVGELLARMRVALRRTDGAGQQVSKPIFTIGDLRIDLAHHQVSRCDIAIHLTPTEERLPPGRYLIDSFPVLSAGPTLYTPQLLARLATGGPAPRADGRAAGRRQGLTLPDRNILQAGDQLELRGPIGGYFMMCCWACSARRSCSSKVSTGTPSRPLWGQQLDACGSSRLSTTSATVIVWLSGLFPGVLVVSIIVVWVAYRTQHLRAVWAAIALPWIYFLMLIGTAARLIVTAARR